MGDLLGAIDLSELNVKQYEESNGEPFPEVMKMPVLMQIVPAWELESVLFRYWTNPEKDYLGFSKQLVESGNETTI